MMRFFAVFLLMSWSAAAQVVGPLQAQNNLAEIAANGTAAQAAARTNLNITGGALSALLVGNGTTSGSPYQFQSASSADPSTLSANPRQNMFFTTLSYGSTSSTIWENADSFVTVNGPGTANGEINAFHAYMQFNAGATVAGLETYEASMFNKGNISGQFAGYLGVFTNDTAGTAGTIYGAKFGLTNSNTTAASIGTWAAIDIEAMIGAGTKPTNYYAIRNADPNGTISTIGQVLIGGLGAAGYSNTNLSISGPDNLGSSWVTFMKNAATSTLFAVADNGQVSLGFGQVVVQPSALGSVIGIQGTDNAAGTYTLASKNLAGTIIFGINNAGVALGGNIVASGAFAANGSTALSLTNIGPPGAHSTVQEWLVISDGTNIRYIPTF